MRPIKYKVLRLKDHIPDRTEYHAGGKVVLPEGFLLAYFRHLSAQGRDMPKIVLFRLSTAAGKQTHCGNLEFTAPAGCVCLPEWMRLHLDLSLLEEVEVTTARLPKARRVVFRPSQGDFMRLDQKVLLEKYLRVFSTLTEGDVIPVAFGDRDYELEVVKAEPAGAVCIAECNVEIDYLPALDEDRARDDDRANAGRTTVGRTISGGFAVIAQKQQQPQPQQPQPQQPQPPPPQAPSGAVSAAVAVATESRGRPDFDWRLGTLQFIRPKMDKETENTLQQEQPKDGPRLRPQPQSKPLDNSSPSDDDDGRRGKKLQQDKFPGEGKTMFS